MVRDRTAKSVEYLNQQGNKLRESTEGIVSKGQELMSQCCGSPSAASGNGARHHDQAGTGE